MTKKCGIATTYTGYNYGSALQAYATKQICKELGYDADIVKIKGLSSGRDIRIIKLLSIAIKTVHNPKKLKKLKAYSKKDVSQQTKCLFMDFYKNDIKPVQTTYGKLRRSCENGYYDFFICGSDQIWNSTIDYVDPFLYLRFIDSKKRIAFAPSFGRDYIAKENIKKISKYINDISYLSVREESGKNLIEKYTSKKAEVLVDPTLVIDKKEWQKVLNLEVKKDDIAVLYFLNEPNDKTKELIKDYCLGCRLKPVIILNNFEFGTESVFVDAGPKEFAELILNSRHVFTDSFHGMIFSANFNTNFTVFAREYNGAANQSARIDSFLNMIKSKDLYNPQGQDDLMKKPNFQEINQVLEKQRKKSIAYLKNSISEVMRDE